MSDLTPEDRALLDLARGGHDPGAGDRDRVRTAIAAQLGIAAGLVSSSAGAVGGASAAGGVPSGVGLVAAKFIGAAALVVSVCAGSAVAYRAMRTAPSAPATTLVAAPAIVARAPVAEKDIPVAAPTVVAAVPVETMTPLTRPEPVVRADRAAQPTTPTGGPAAISHAASRFAGATDIHPAVANAAPLDTAATAPVAPGNAETLGLAPVVPTATGTSGMAVASSPSPSSLLAETELIRAGLAALHVADPARALALFDQHEREFPAGILADERDVERIAALCDLGRRADARTRASSFLRRRPNAPLTGRVLSSCGNPTRSIP